MIEGLEEEQKSTAAKRCARIYAECNRKPGKTGALTLFNPNISKYILQSSVHDEENLFNNQDLCYLLITFFFLTTICLIDQCYYKEKLNIGHSLGVKGLSLKADTGRGRDDFSK